MENKLAATEKTIPRWENWTIILILFFASGAAKPFYNLRGLTNRDILAGDPIVQVLWATIYVYTSIMILIRTDNIYEIINKNILLLLIIFYTLLSASWSLAPFTSTRAAIALTGTTITGLYIGSRTNQKTVLLQLGIALNITALASLFTIVFLPQLGIHHDIVAGSWRGIFEHKNIMARVMLLNAIVWLSIATLHIYKKQSIPILSISLSFLLLLCSGSKTSLISFLLIGIVYILTRRPFTNGLIIGVILNISIASGALIAVLILSLPSLSLESLLTLIGRDSTLSSRNIIWSMVWQDIHNHFWFGYGYNAYWLGPFGPSGWIDQYFSKHIAHAHNGPLSLWIELGATGLCLMFTLIYYFFRNLLQKWDIKTLTHGNLFPLLFILMVLIINLTENTLLVKNNIFWLLFVTLFVTLQQQNKNNAHS